MLACVDVDYRRDGSAVAACLAFATWSTHEVAASYVTRIDRVSEPYQPGSLYRRELPCLLSVLTAAATAFEVVIVDAYVTLDTAGRPGLGARLHDALDGTPVVGVAKTRFEEAAEALPVFRGASRVPLWISSAGMTVATAAENVRSMHGEHRIPTLLGMVDRLARKA